MQSLGKRVKRLQVYSREGGREERRREGKGGRGKGEKMEVGQLFREG